MDQSIVTPIAKAHFFSFATIWGSISTFLLSNKEALLVLIPLMTGVFAAFYYLVSAISIIREWFKKPAEND